MGLKQKKRVESDVERAHGHCADVLMGDYGIHKSKRKQVCEEIAKVWKQITLLHCMIICSVRRYQPHPATRDLESFLNRHKTHLPKNRKPERAEVKGHYDSKGHYHRD